MIFRFTFTFNYFILFYHVSFIFDWEHFKTHKMTSINNCTGAFKYFINPKWTGQLYIFFIIKVTFIVPKHVQNVCLYVMRVFLCVNIPRERHACIYNDDVMSFNWIHTKAWMVCGWRDDIVANSKNDDQGSRIGFCAIKV